MLFLELLLLLDLLLLFLVLQLVGFLSDFGPLPLQATANPRRLTLTLDNSFEACTIPTILGVFISAKHTVLDHFTTAAVVESYLHQGFDHVMMMMFLMATDLSL